MQGLLSRLEQWLTEHRPRFHRNLLPGASPAELGLLNKLLPKPLPQELIDWFAWHNGQGDDFVGYFEGHWLLMSVARIILAKTELDDADFNQGWSHDWLPFLEDDGGNFVCLDLGRPQRPVVVFWLGGEPEAIAPSLEAWLGELVAAMEAGEYREDPERGTFQRQIGDAEA